MHATHDMPYAVVWGGGNLYFSSGRRDNSLVFAVDTVGNIRIVIRGDSKWRDSMDHPAFGTLAHYNGNLCSRASLTHQHMENSVGRTRKLDRRYAY